MNQIIFDDAPARQSKRQPHEGAVFNRDDAPPENTPLRLLLEDDRGEYSAPFAYEYDDEQQEFFSVHGGLAPAPEIKVAGWMIWEGGR